MVQAKTLHSIRSEHFHRLVEKQERISENGNHSTILPFEFDRLLAQFFLGKLNKHFAFLLNILKSLNKYLVVYSCFNLFGQS